MTPYNIRTTITSPGAVKTELLDHISETDVQQANRDYVGQVGVPADSFARVVAFAISQPEELDINEILLGAKSQELSSARCELANRPADPARTGGAAWPARLGGCKGGRAATSGPPAAVATDAAPLSARLEESRMWMTVGERRFTIILTDSAAARAFEAQLPLTLDMHELNGNEKHADLPEALPANASRPGTIRIGDLMLYGANTLVVFYATFNSSYSYTCLGRVDDPADLPQTLGRRGIRVVFSND